MNYRTVACFYFDPDFHRYPLDQDTLPIVVEHERHMDRFLNGNNKRPGDWLENMQRWVCAQHNHPWPPV